MVIEMFKFELIFDTIISLDFCKNFAFIESLSESFVPTFAEVELLSSWDIEFFHDLFGLLENVLPTHCGIIQNEIGQSDFHLGIEGFSASFLLF